MADSRNRLVMFTIHSTCLRSVLALSKTLSVGLVLSAFLPTQAHAAADDPNEVIIATGSENGAYYATAQGICAALQLDAQESQRPIKCTIEGSGGALANLDHLRQGKVTLALGQSNIVYNAYHAEDWFAQRPFKNLRTVFTLFVEPVTVVAAPESGIKSFADLKDKRFNVGASGSGTQTTMKHLFQAYGVTEGFFKKTSNLEAMKLGQALCKDQIDAFMYIDGQPSSIVRNPTTTCKAQLVPIEGQAADKLTATAPYYDKYVIPGGLYQNNPQDTPTVGGVAALVTSEEIDPKLIYRIVGAVMQHFDVFKEKHKALEYLDKSQMSHRGLMAPLHPGAEQYFTEQGL